MSYYDVIHTIESFDDAFSLMQYTVQKMKECNLAPGDIEDYIYDAISKDNMHLVECSKKILYKCILEERKNNNFNNNDLYTYYDDSNWYNDECYNDKCYNDDYINNDGYHLSLFDHDISMSSVLTSFSSGNMPSTNCNKFCNLNVPAIPNNTSRRFTG